jgi:hypothetical protein
LTVPALVNVCVNVFPRDLGVESNELSSADTVWGFWSTNFHSTVAPTLTPAGDGM